jgi:Cysteine rich repeat
MKEIGISVVIALIIGFVSGPALAEKDLVETISRDCKGEIARYCGSVSPGRSRVLACLYAYIDKLTSHCGLALIDSSSELDRTIANLAVAAKGCGDDLRTYCSRERPGEGRLLGCLDRNKDKVSALCKEALKAGGLNEF